MALQAVGLGWIARVATALTVGAGLSLLGAVTALAITNPRRQPAEAIPARIEEASAA